MQMQYSSINSQSVILRFEAPKIDYSHKIERLIRKARIFYLLFFVLYSTAISIDLVIDLSSNPSLHETLLLINTPIFALVYILEMVVLKDFVEASLKFIHVMNSMQPMNVPLAKAYIWLCAVVMVLDKFCFCIMMNLTKLDSIFLDNRYCT